MLIKIVVIPGKASFRNYLKEDFFSEYSEPNKQLSLWKYVMINDLSKSYFQGFSTTGPDDTIQGKLLAWMLLNRQWMSTEYTTL